MDAWAGENRHQPLWWHAASLTVHPHTKVLWFVCVCVANVTGSGEYLVKWQGLPYSECTQEDSDLIRRHFPLAVDEYIRRQKSTCLPSKTCKVNLHHCCPVIRPVDISLVLVVTVMLAVHWVAASCWYIGCVLCTSYFIRVLQVWWHYCVCVCVYTGAGAESPTQVYCSKNSARIFGTWREDGVTRLPVGRLELVAAFLVQVGNM